MKMLLSAFSCSEVIGAISTAAIVIIGTPTTLSITSRSPIIGYRGWRIDDRNSKRRKFIFSILSFVHLSLSALKKTSLPTNKAGQSKWRTFQLILGRVTLATIITAAGTFYYITQKDRHPGAQLPFDPEKKTIVVLGSGWGATSLLKTLDTADYNVVSVYRSGQSQVDMP
jgi:hypothetical protein